MPIIPEEELTSPKSVDLASRLLTFLTDRFPNNPKNVKMLFCSLIYSAFLQKEKYIDCDIFYKFCTGEFKPLELSYFMFIRALIEKETRKKIFNFELVKSIDIRTFYLSMHQLDGILESLFGVGKTVKINRFKQKIFMFDGSIKESGKIHFYDLLLIALTDYSNMRKYTQ